MIIIFLYLGSLIFQYFYILSVLVFYILRRLGFCQTIFFFFKGNAINSIYYQQEKFSAAKLL